MNGESGAKGELASHPCASLLSEAAEAVGERPARDEGPAWNAESFVIVAENRDDLRTRVQALLDFVRETPDARPADLAAALARHALRSGYGAARLGLVAGSISDLATRLARAAEKLADPNVAQIRDVSGIYFTENPLFLEGRLALLFPGEGTPFVGMVGDLARHFPEVAEVLDYCDAVQAETDPDAPSASRFLRIGADAPADVRAEAEEGLKNFDDSVASTMTASYALLALLCRLEIPYTATAGHSAGEIVALGAAGAVTSEGPVAVAMGRSMRESTQHATEPEAPTTLLAAAGSRETVAEAVVAAVGAPPVSRDEIISGETIGPERVYLAMDNCPHQTVVVGPSASVVRVEQELLQRRVMCERLPLHLPYHTPLFEPHLGPLTLVFNHMKFQPPAMTVYSCSTAEPFPEDPDVIKRQAIHQWAEPVEFTRLIRRMHADGVRLFVECGPRATLTGFVDDVLRGQSYLAMPTNVPRKSGVTQLSHVVAQLAAHHTPLNLEKLYDLRPIEPVAWNGAAAELFSTPEEEAASSAPPEATDSSTDDDEMLAPLNVDAAPPRHRIDLAFASIDSPPASVRDAVMLEYLRTMEIFLATQQSVMQAYLAGDFAPPANGATVEVQPAIAEADLDATSDACRDASLGPLVGELVEFEPGVRLVMRRPLDLREDLYVADHTVGGRKISRIDPTHTGLPIQPMTFSLEMMAECALLLAPGKVVASLKNVLLSKWIGFDDRGPVTVEVTAATAEIKAEHPADEVQVQITIRLLADGPGGDGVPYVTSQGLAVLRDEYPAAPEAPDLGLTSAPPSTIDFEWLYHGLFHGPRFQGVLGLPHRSPQGIVSRIVVAPRDDLLASNPEPNWTLDPILLDVAMHGLAAWHLEEADQSGRIMLPFALPQLDFFGPPPAEGEELNVFASVDQQTPRQAVHSLAVARDDGRVWCWMRNARYWRYYFPFGEYNFHGPKDEYFLGEAFPALEPAEATACVQFTPPDDLRQAPMGLVGAKVTLTPEEFDAYREEELSLEERLDGLFRRIGAKDSIRILWRRATGEKLFLADIQLAADEHGVYHAVFRENARDEALPLSAAAMDGSHYVTAASFDGRPGVGVVVVPKQATDEEILLGRRTATARAAAQAFGVAIDEVAVGAAQPDAHDAAVAWIEASSAHGVIAVRTRLDDDVVAAVGVFGGNG